jgi:uncharacterized LabA/DUF88 family protein
MGKIILIILLTIIATTAAKANDQDTLWFRIAGAGIQELDFTPDDKYVIAWTNAIEFWEVEKGVKEFSIPIDINAVGDYNYNGQYLVFAKDSTPKLLDWKTKEVIEGFEKEEENIGRIRTAKSKNEFIANTYHKVEDFPDDIGNVIYFYDIDNKKKVDSIIFLKQYEEGYTWKRTIHDYDYVGNNDEFIYVVIDDVNDEIVNIPAQLRKRHYFIHFYDRESKELVDSVYSFTNTNTQFGGFNKMQVMNDRAKIAWNNKGGEINFYDFYTKQFYDKLVFDSNKYAEVNDIDYAENENIIGIASNINLQIIKSKNEILQKLDYGVEHIKFPKDSDFFVISGGSFLSLYKKQWLKTDVNESYYRSETTISPHPTSNFVNIELNCSEPKVDYQINDVNGALVAQSTIANQSGNLQLDFSDYTSGIYFITINCKEPMTYKIIKE